MLAYRELDDALGLMAIAGRHLVDGRTGRNGQHDLVGMLRQSVFGRLAGYEDDNDADRLGRDPAMRRIVGGNAVERNAASTSQMGRFETEWLASDENLAALTGLSGQWIDCAHGHRPLRSIVLDMDSSVSPTHGDQEGTAYNGHFACTCYHPLFVFNQFGDLERSALRPGNVHSADGWKDVLAPAVARYRERDLRRYFRADAAFANPEVYEFLEAEGYKYTIRLPASRDGQFDTVTGNWFDFSAEGEQRIRPTFPYTDGLANAVEGGWSTGSTILKRSLRPRVSETRMPWEMAECYLKALSDERTQAAYVDHDIVRMRQDSPGRLTHLHDHFEPLKACRFWMEMKAAVPLNEDRRSAFDRMIFRFLFTLYHEGRHENLHEVFASLDRDRLGHYAWSGQFSPPWVRRDLRRAARSGAATRAARADGKAQALTSADFAGGLAVSQASPRKRTIRTADSGR